MHRLGIGLMAFGATATLVLIGIDAHGSSMFAALVLGAGALAAFFAGCMIYSHTSAEHAETKRFDRMANSVEDDARIHLLENREADLIRQVATLESRRDEILAELAAVHGSAGPSPHGNPPPPNLIVVPDSD
jgi:hypothetical protein